MYMHVQVYMYMYIPPLFSWGHLGCEVDLWAVYKSALEIISTVHVQCTCIHVYMSTVYMCIYVYLIKQYTLNLQITYTMHM